MRITKYRYRNPEVNLKSTSSFRLVNVFEFLLRLVVNKIKNYYMYVYSYRTSYGVMNQWISLSAQGLLGNSMRDRSSGAEVFKNAPYAIFSGSEFTPKCSDITKLKSLRHNHHPNNHRSDIPINREMFTDPAMYASHNEGLCGPTSARAPEVGSSFH